MAKTQTREILNRIIRTMKDIENIKNSLYNAYDDLIMMGGSLHEPSILRGEVKLSDRKLGLLNTKAAKLRRLIHARIEPSLEDAESELRRLMDKYNDEHAKESAVRLQQLR